VQVLQLAPLDTPVLAWESESGSATMASRDLKSSNDEATPCSSAVQATGKRRHRARRPCRGKRIRLKNLMSRMCAQVECEPTSFNISDIELPPSLIANPRKLQLFRAQVEFYQQQVSAGERPKCLPQDVQKLVPVQKCLEGMSCTRQW